MKPEEQRIALAELDGWNSLGQDAETVEWWIQMPNEVIPRLSYSELKRLRRYELPDYLKDLNAVHEVEKRLTHDQKLTYQEELWRVSHDPGFASWGYIHAPAALRGEAILRATGKWREE